MKKSKLTWYTLFLRTDSLKVKILLVLYLLKHTVCFSLTRKKRQAEWETYMRRMINRYKKDVLVDTHKVTAAFPSHPCRRRFCSPQIYSWSRRFTWCAWLLTGCSVTGCAANRTCWPSRCRSCLPSAARSPRSASTRPTSLGCFSGARRLGFLENWLTLFWGIVSVRCHKGHLAFKGHNNPSYRLKYQIKLLLNGTLEAILWVHDFTCKVVVLCNHIFLFLFQVQDNIHTQHQSSLWGESGPPGSAGEKAGQFVSQEPPRNDSCWYFGKRAKWWVVVE